MTFADLLKEHKIPYKSHGEHHHVSHGWIGIDCPDCSPGSGKYRLGYNIRGGFMSCWSCGPKKTKAVIQALTGIPWKDLNDIVRTLAQDRVPVDIPKRGTVQLPKGVGPLLPQHCDYLESRGFNPETIQTLWGVKGIGRRLELGWRLFIPVTHRNEIVSWTTRAIGKQKARYISAKPQEEKFALPDLLYGEDYTRNSVVICEGPMDVWKIGPGAVATFGLNVSLQQIRHLARYQKRYICFDREPVAQRKADSLADALSVFDGETYVIRLHSGKDPGEIDKSELKDLRKLLQ
jgi:hypothetical protein